jgi:hypothetical protein
MRSAAKGLGFSPNLVGALLPGRTCRSAKTGSLTYGALTRSEPYSGEIMNPFYQNQSCDPWTPPQQICELGNYVTYSIDIAQAEDVVAGVQFSKAQNVRLVIKNTGHE